MGLDMYLSKKTYVKNWDYMKPKERHKVTVKGPRAALIKPERVSYIVEEVAYWRKANAIHNWFVQNVQGGKDECQESYVEIAQLKALVELCKKVLDTGEAWLEGVAKNHLPPTPGFFFGSTAIDEYYLDDLRRTVDMLQPEIDNAAATSARCDYYYRASW